MPNLGTGRDEGGARARQQGEVEAPGCPAGRVRQAGVGGGGDEGFPGSAGHEAFLCSPRPRFQRRLPRASEQGSRCPSGRDAVNQPGPAAFAPARAGRRPRRGREPHVDRLAPDSARPVPAVPARLPGAGPTGGARSPEPGSAPGNRRCFSREGFLQRSSDGGVGRAREAGAAAGQPGSASVPCPGTAVICAPHRTQLGSSPPSRPALSAARPFLAGHRLRGGAWREIPPTWLFHPLQPASCFDGQTSWPMKIGR